MHTLAFVTQKGGAGKTTLAASLAVAAAQSGEKVIALDLDPQGSLAAWGERRQGDKRLTVEPLSSERTGQMEAILAALGRQGYTLALLDTAGVDNANAHVAIQAADLCLLPARPTRVDIESTGTTFRAVMRMGRRLAFVLNQCPPQPRNMRSQEAAAGLRMLGVLADPFISTRADFQDAIAAGQGPTEYAADGKAAQEIVALWHWAQQQLKGNEHVVKAAVGH